MNMQSLRLFMCLSAFSCHNLLQKKDKTKDMKAITDVLKFDKKQM
jgi:hypothetical protein